MRLGRWSVLRGERGWLVFRWAQDGYYVSSYPIPKYWWAVPCYPWMVWRSLKAIRAHRRMAQEMVWGTSA